MNCKTRSYRILVIRLTMYDHYYLWQKLSIWGTRELNEKDRKLFFTSLSAFQECVSYSSDGMWNAKIYYPIMSCLSGVCWLCCLSLLFILSFFVRWCLKMSLIQFAYAQWNNTNKIEELKILCPFRLSNDKRYNR